MAVLFDDVERIVGLQHQFLRPRIDHLVLALFEHGKFVLQVYSLQQQGVVDHLRPQIRQGLRRWSCYVVVTDNELVLGRNPQFELLAVTHHVEHVVLQDREKSDHPQRGRLAGQDVAPDFLIFRDFAPFAAADGSCNADCGPQRLDIGGLGVDSVN